MTSALRMIDLKPTVATEPVGTDPDDPASWVHPRQPEKSLVLGTNKTSAAEGGALYVFGLDGKIRQVFGGLDRPNNVAISGSLAVVTERLKSRLRFFRITDSPKPLTDAGALPVFVGDWGPVASGASLPRPAGKATMKESLSGASMLSVPIKSSVVVSTTASRSPTPSRRTLSSGAVPTRPMASRFVTSRSENDFLMACLWQ
ncbi:MAG: phytase [Armatimonadetes bacterium]|nr:phytase [Armatimonadota bacterium]